MVLWLMISHEYTDGETGMGRLGKQRTAEGPPPTSMPGLLDPKGRCAVSPAEITFSPTGLRSPLAWLWSHHMFIVVSIIRLNLQAHVCIFDFLAQMLGHRELEICSKSH